MLLAGLPQCDGARREDLERRGRRAAPDVRGLQDAHVLRTELPARCVEGPQGRVCEGRGHRRGRAGRRRGHSARGRGLRAALGLGRQRRGGRPRARLLGVAKAQVRARPSCRGRSLQSQSPPPPLQPSVQHRPSSTSRSTSRASPRRSAGAPASTCPSSRAWIRRVSRGSTGGRGRTPRGSTRWACPSSILTWSW